MVGQEDDPASWLGAGIFSRANAILQVVKIAATNPGGSHPSSWTIAAAGYIPTYFLLGQ